MPVDNGWLEIYADGDSISLSDDMIVGQVAVEEPTFTEIPNPAVDVENKMILSQWRNWAASHSWAEYKFQDNAYVQYRELCEEAVGYDEDGNDRWRTIFNNGLTADGSIYNEP